MKFRGRSFEPSPSSSARRTNFFFRSAAFRRSALPRQRTAACLTLRRIRKPGRDEGTGCCSSRCSMARRPVLVVYASSDGSEKFLMGRRDSLKSYAVTAAARLRGRSPRQTAQTATTARRKLMAQSGTTARSRQHPSLQPSTQESTSGPSLPHPNSKTVFDECLAEVSSASTFLAWSKKNDIDDPDASCSINSIRRQGTPRPSHLEPLLSHAQHRRPPSPPAATFAAAPPPGHVPAPRVV